MPQNQIEQIVQKLHYSGGSGRSKAAEALLQLGEPGGQLSIESLIYMMLNDTTPLRRAAAEILREKGVSAFVGDGSNRWLAVHRLDAASLFLLAVEAAPAGSRLHGAAEEGVPFRDIAEAIGRQHCCGKRGRSLRLAWCPGVGR